jgi:predicted RNase H-like HicB family nuclease
MQYQIFIQNLAERHFKASVMGMPACMAEGATKEEALASVKSALEEQLAQGEVVTLTLSTALPSESPVQPVNPILPKGNHSALPGYGMFKDNPRFDDFIERMAEYRAEIDANEPE